MSDRNAFRSLMRAMFLGFVRDRRALFFTVLFPLFFLVMFGGLFNNMGTPKADIIQVGPVTVLDRAGDGLHGVLTITKSEDLDKALDKVEKGDSDAVVRQDGDRLVVRYSAADRTTAGMVRQIMKGVVQRANQAASNTKPKYSMTATRVEDKALGPIQYYTPGLLGWAIASAALFGASATLVTWRTKGTLRRLRLSPAPPWGIFTARVGVSLGVALLQAALFIAVATLPMFGLQLSDFWWMSIPVILCGTLAFLSIGLLIGARASTQESANAMTQIVVLPMAFLGGSFFPTDIMPQWLRVISQIFPLRHLNEAMLNVMVRGEGPASVLPQIGILLGFTLVIGVIAARLFRWDEV